ncbi:hypothetical protein JCM13580A_02030 [Streptomyces drozdowiczii]
MRSWDVAISSPKAGAEVLRCLRSVTGAGQVSDGHSLWMAVEFEDGNGGHRVLFSKRAQMNGDTWHTDRIDVGGKGQALNSYTLTAVDVDRATDAMLTSTVVDMAFSTAETRDPGADIWRISYAGYPSGVKPVAQVSVTRAEDDDRSCNDTRAGNKKRQGQ